MAILKSVAALGAVAIAYPSCAGETVTQRYSFQVPDTIKKDDIIELAPIPPGARVVDIVLDSDELDTNVAATMVVDVGIMSGDWGSEASDRTCGDQFFDGIDTVQAGGVARPTLPSAYRQPAADVARSIGVKVVTAAATAAAGEIGLTVTIAG